MPILTKTDLILPFSTLTPSYWHQEVHCPSDIKSCYASWGTTESIKVLIVV